MASVNIRNRRNFIYPPFVANPQKSKKIVFDAPSARRIGKTRMIECYTTTYAEEQRWWRNIRRSLARNPNSFSKRQLRSIRRKSPIYFNFSIEAVSLRVMLQEALDRRAGLAE